MMRSHYFLTACVSFLVSGSVYSLDTVLLSPEGVKVMLPPELSSVYTQDYLLFTEEQTIFRYVPLGETGFFSPHALVTNFYRQSNLYPLSPELIPQFLNDIRSNVGRSLGLSKFTWKVIAQSNSEAIYEILFHEDSTDSIIRHDIARIIVTNRGVHSILYTNQPGKLKDKERELWIKSLRDSFSIVKNGNGEKKKRETTAERLQESINLGEAFSNWKVISEEISPKSRAVVTKLIPKNELNPRDVMDVTTLAGIRDISINEIFQDEISEFSELMEQKIDVRFLKKSENELIYTYSYKNEGSICNAVVRSIIQDKAYYHVLYTRVLSKLCDSNEIETIKALLEKIQF